MPTYEYACMSCGSHLEVYQRISEEPLRECGSCGGVLRKVFHPAGILFKGSGFYATDSRAARKKAAETGSSDSSKGPEGTGAPAKADAGSSKAGAEPASRGTAKGEAQEKTA